METDREAATAMEPMEEEPKTEHTEQSSGWRSWVWENTGVAYDVAHLNRADPFFVKQSGVTWWTEIRAGTVTFLTMSFILPVNALIMSIAIGEEHKDDLVVATAVVSAVSSALMGLLANYPFGLAPGMGMNAYFVFTVVLQKQVEWQDALTAVFFSGWLFLITTILGLRRFVLSCIPRGVQLALSAGIGLFLAFIGAQPGGGMGIIVGDPVTLVRLNEPLSVSGNYDAAKMWVSALVLTATVSLMAMGVKGAPLLGIALGTLIAWAECWARGPEKSVMDYPFGECADVSQTGLNGTECFCYAPERVAAIPKIDTAGAFAFDFIQKKEFWVAVITFYFNDMIGCAGTLIAVTRKAGIVDAQGRIPKGRTNMAFLVDSVGTIIGSCLGTSTVTTYVESAAGIVDGGRTGVVALVVGIWFALAVPFAPVISQIPDLATGPILVIVGASMLTTIEGFDWGSSNIEEALPAFITLMLIPLTFNIAYGIIAGTLFWIIIQILLMPVRLVKKEDPFVKFKELFCVLPREGV